MDDVRLAQIVPMNHKTCEDFILQISHYIRKLLQYWNYCKGETVILCMKLKVEQLPARVVSSISLIIPCQVCRAVNEIYQVHNRRQYPTLVLKITMPAGTY